MISIEDVSAGYGGQPVLRNVTLSVARGAFAGLIGPNGCGKTTLLRVIGGVLTPSEGQVRLRGRNVREIGRGKLARTMACLPQHFSMDLAFTVREVVLMGRSPHLPRIGCESGNDFAIAERAMRLADVSHLADRLVTEISGGERQRVLIAMCLAQEPEVLLLDEPTSHLDIGHQMSILDLIARLNRQIGMTVVAVFHDLNLAAEYCHRLLVLDRGRVAALGAPEDVLTTDLISAVYGMRVLVEPNPLTKKPHIVLAAGTYDGNKEAARSAALD
jgi:iron complex transport system ATP-binding protein